MILYGDAGDTTETEDKKVDEQRYPDAVNQKELNYVEGIDDMMDASHEHLKSLQTLENIVSDHFYEYAHDEVVEEDHKNESKMFSRDELLTSIKKLRRINLPQAILDDFPEENEDQNPHIEQQAHTDHHEPQHHPVHQPPQDQQDTQGCVVHYHYHYHYY